MKLTTVWTMAALFMGGCAANTSKEVARPAAANVARPNVLFIIVDDLNTRIGCYGDPVARTPNIDRLAARGVRFDRAYCQYPVCNPSRTSFLSGLYPETTRVWAQDIRLKQTMPEVVYLPEHFRNQGYFTAAVGKVEHGGHRDVTWDLFDDVKGGGEEDDGDEARPRGRRAAGGAASRPVRTLTRSTGGPAYTVARQTAEDDPELADIAIASKAIEVMEKQKEGPFFIAVGFHKPHVPHVAPKRFFEMYPLDAVQPVSVPPDDEKDIPAAALASKANYQPQFDDAQKRSIIRAYLAAESHMDEQLGRVLDAMDRLSLWDKTVVVFLGDHGWQFGEHNWWAKASLFEPSARSPLVIAAPGVRRGEGSGRVVGFVDLYPTLTDLCSLPPPPQGQGRSLTPLLSNPAAPWPHAAYTALGAGPRGRSVRTERYRYTEWAAGAQGVELYDHDADPQEHINRANDPAFASAVDEMKRLLHSGPGEVRP